MDTPVLIALSVIGLVVVLLLRKRYIMYKIKLLRKDYSKLSTT